MANNYYPFGLTFNSYQRVTAKQNDYLYNGKELQDELDLNWLDYGARMYEPAIGRFTSLDIKSHKYHPISPYGFVANNPINLIDFDGKEIVNPYKKGTKEYETVNRSIAVLQKSNPNLYGSLESSTIKIIIQLRNLPPKDATTIRKGNTSANRRIEGTKTKLSVRSNIYDSEGNRTLAGASYFITQQMSSIPIDKETERISETEAREYVKERVTVTHIDVSIDPSLSKEEQAAILAHEGGHALNVLESPFTAFIWSLLDENEGHEKHNPSGQIANQEEQKARDYISNLTLADRKRISDEFQKKKDEEEKKESND